MKKIVSLLLALLLVAGLLAGCAGDTGTTAPSVAPSKAPTSQTPGDDTDPVEDAFAWPLAETKTFKIWNGPYAVTAGMTDPNSSFGYQEAELRLNVKIEWDQPAEGMAQESFSLIVASNNYPDAFMSCTPAFYIGGLDKFVDDEIIVDMLPWLEQFAPNWMAMANVDEKTWKTSKTDGGYVAGLYNISKEVEPTWWGPQMREDYLIEFGMNAPKTYDDWYAYLTAAKDQKGSTRGYMFRGVDGLDDNLMLGFDIYKGFFAKNGEVNFGAYTSEFKQYLELVSSWYAEGLIDPDYTGRAASYFGDTAIVYNGEVSAWHRFWTSFDIDKANAIGEYPTFQGKAVQVPMQTADGTRKLTLHSVPDSRLGGVFNTISTQCSDVELLIRWFDYFYGEEGEILADYGVEGQGHDIVNGKPVLSSLITANPDGLSQNDAMALYTIGTMHSRQYDWARSNTGRSEYCLEAGGIWDGNWDMNAGFISSQGWSLTAAESEIYTPMINDINTYISETVVAFINGTKPLSDFDSYMAQLKSMGIETCIEIYQAAHDRYVAR